MKWHALKHRLANHACQECAAEGHMKLSKLFIVISIVMLTGAGCAHRVPAPEFHQTYLPNTVPGSPQKRIDLPKEVIDKAMSGWWSRSYLPVSLYWTEEDRLFFNVHERNDPDTLLYSFSIVPSTSEVRLLQAAERQAVANAMAKSGSVVSADTWVDGVGRAIGIIFLVGANVVAHGSGGNMSFTYDYTGTVENNGVELSFDISESAGKYSYSAKNGQTGITIKGDGRFEPGDSAYEEEIHELRDWLRSWRVSPDGRYYLIGKTAVLVDPRAGTFTALIEKYRPNYVRFDISPLWDQIALLKREQDGRTKEMRYRLEFYRFDIR